MRVLVCGSRSWSDRSIIRLELARLLQEHGDDLEVIHGAAPQGADLLADMVCEQLSIPREPYPADWAKDGRTAGFKRNLEMLQTGPDLVLAFHRDGSPGTKHCIENAEAMGIEVKVVRWPHKPVYAGGPR